MHICDIMKMIIAAMFPSVKTRQKKDQFMLEVHSKQPSDLYGCQCYIEILFGCNAIYKKIASTDNDMDMLKKECT